eukprot:375887_1
MSSIYESVVEPVVDRESKYFSDLVFLTNEESSGIIINVGGQTKANPGLAFGLSEAMILNSCRNGQSKIHGYPPMNIHQHYTFFTKAGDSKTSPMEWVADAQIK